MKNYVEISPVAKGIPFDNATNGFVSTDVQAAIEEVSQTGGVSASPGFTWGSNGTITKGSYLLNDTVPSNVAGRIVPLDNGKIRKVFVSCETAASFIVNIQKRSGAAFVDVVSVTMTAARTGVFDTNSSVALNDEIAIRIDPTSTDNPKNVVVGIVIKGTVAL